MQGKTPPKACAGSVVSGPRGWPAGTSLPTDHHAGATRIRRQDRKAGLATGEKKDRPWRRDRVAKVGQWTKSGEAWVFLDTLGGALVRSSSVSGRGERSAEQRQS